MTEIKILLIAGFILYHIIRFFVQKRPLSTNIESNIPKSHTNSNNGGKTTKPPIFASIIENGEESEYIKKSYTDNNDIDQKSRFKEFENEAPNNRYLEKIRNPESFRDAFIISEIIHKKY